MPISRHSDNHFMAAVLLVLFPILLMFDTRLAAVAIVVALVWLYNRRATR
jgi:hypothetical protein